MSDDQPLPPAETFSHLSSEYAQALGALKALEEQAPTLLVLGNGDELLVFIEQFVTMATGVRTTALAAHEPNFVEWFDELIARAAILRAAAAPR